MTFECCNNKPVISCKEFTIPKNPAVLEDPPTSTNEEGINLLRYPSSIAIPSPVVQLWSLIPRTCDSQPSGFFKIQERNVGVPGSRAGNSCQWQYLKILKLLDQIFFLILL